VTRGGTNCAAGWDSPPPERRLKAARRRAIHAFALTPSRFGGGAATPPWKGQGWHV
jgi:hypothetical protein